MASVLVVGGGGREHALAWKLSQSSSVEHVFISPTNPGSLTLKKVVQADVDVCNNARVVQWCQQRKIDLVVVGPEQPLARGLADELRARGIHCFGPSKEAAELEASKEFAKCFMDRNGIPTARWRSFTRAQEARRFIHDCGFRALVVKASGLAAGKGVVVAKTVEEASEAVDKMLERGVLGDAGKTVVVEELLEGEEFSAFAFSDGVDFCMMPICQDHKRLLDGDRGPNTGGMGAYCPCLQIDANTVELIKKEILAKTIEGMRKEKRPFVGVLYAGLMLTSAGPKVLEYNCRFGDPEAQVLLPLFSSDLYLTLLACATRSLSSAIPLWDRHNFAVGVVLASEGYPSTSVKNKRISGLDEVGREENLIIFHAGTKLNEGEFFSDGGRVLAVVAVRSSLVGAARAAQIAAGKIQFDGVQRRHDIACKGFTKCSQLTYADSGVDIDAGERLVRLIGPLAEATHRPGVLGSLGGFGGVFDLSAINKYRDPLLVSGTDGVGSKLKIAQSVGLHSDVGIDLVAMCVNDVLMVGGEPLFFLDYFACSRLSVETAKDVVAGISLGCCQARCALLGGETAEMPGMYSGDDYDVAGFAVGVVDKCQVLPRVVKEGDVAICVASSGLHSNGFSLIRKIVSDLGLDLKSPAPFNPNSSLAEELLKPTKIYVATLLPVLRKEEIKAAAHITGGGITNNVCRVVPHDLTVRLDATKWNIPSLFVWLAECGISTEEMLRTFNCGVGVVLLVDKIGEEKILDELKEAGEEAWVAGQVEKRVGSEASVIVENMEKVLLKSSVEKFSFSGKVEAAAKKKVAVLISGTGTNLQALIDSTSKKSSKSEIVLVISNVADAVGLKRAEKANIPVRVIEHKKYKSRVQFDMAVHDVLIRNGVEIVCLAGFMRILSGEFVKLWEGRLINIHPSLLPSFPGLQVHQRVLDSGVRLTGCTVHFVVEEVDAGGIIVQESVAVLPGDTEEMLADRVKRAEHRAYPLALHFVAEGRASLGSDNKVKFTDLN